MVYKKTRKCKKAFPGFLNTFFMPVPDFPEFRLPENCLNRSCALHASRQMNSTNGWVAGLVILIRYGSPWFRDE